LCRIPSKSRQLSFEVLPADLFDSFIPDASRVSGLKGQVLAKVNDAGLLVGDWRIAANGREDITVSFSGAQIYDAPELSGFDFTIELPPRDFGFSANRISSEWTNLHTSVSERKIAVSHCSDNCLNETSYLETARGPSIRGLLQMGSGHEGGPSLHRHSAGAAHVG
jgi:hypothetical protein